VAETEFMVRGKGYLRGAADLEQIVLKAQGGTPVLLQDVARVELAQLEQLRGGFFDFAPGGASRIKELGRPGRWFGRVVTTLGIFFLPRKCCEGACTCAT